MSYRKAAILLGILGCTIALWFASRPARKPSTAVLRDIPYIRDGDPSQKLDLYLPAPTDNRPMPVVIWIHGGGWNSGSKSRCLATGLTDCGYAVASVEYRFSDKAAFPAQIQDCQAAVRWLRANSAKYNIDRDHIGVWGESAGGHLAALLATSGGKKAFAAVGGDEDQSDRVQAALDWYGPADFSTLVAQAAAGETPSAVEFNKPGDPYSALVGAPLDQSPENCAAASPVHYVSGDSAPMLIMHGTADPIVPFAQGVELTDTFKKAGADVIFQPMPGSGHGGPAFARPAVQRLIQNFFDRHLKSADVKVEPLPTAAATVEPAK